MVCEGFAPDFPAQVTAEVQSMSAAPAIQSCRDLRTLLWSSIDNVESRDLDQVEWAERLPNDDIRVLVAIADVDSIVKKASATDAHAQLNATSVYTGGPVFPMLPERLSTDLTSLCQDKDRPAIIMEFIVAKEGKVTCSEVCTDIVRNQARLNYDQVGKWLGNQANSPSECAADPALCQQLRLQEEASQRLKHFRDEQGALAFGGVESVPIIVDNAVKSMAIVRANPARDIIENFMIAANVAMAGFLRNRNALCIRRVVRTPKRWDRIQAIAAQFGARLPAQPDPRPLGEFLAQRKQADPDGFPELSLAILKSLGPGEYIVEHPGAEHQGHFGLAVEDYTHSTAPNRRYADLLMQRLLKAVVAGDASPFAEAELSQLATHCTERESAARHVERFMKKVAAALMLQSQIGHSFDAIVTGVAPKGTFARLLKVPAEGRVMRGERGLDIGQRIRVRLASVDPEHGFIDFVAA
jgi:VacB/RNase II family 3'-5' exoribonuclease